MDLLETIRQLYEERARLDDAIASLEHVVLARNNGKGAAPGRRGRKKGMSAEERDAIAQRMREYWAKRRQQAIRL